MWEASAERELAVEHVEHAAVGLPPDLCDRRPLVEKHLEITRGRRDGEVGVALAVLRAHGFRIEVNEPRCIGVGGAEAQPLAVAGGAALAVDAVLADEQEDLLDAVDCEVGGKGGRLAGRRQFEVDPMDGQLVTRAFGDESRRRAGRGPGRLGRPAQNSPT